MRILLVGMNHGAQVRGANLSVHGLARALAARHQVTLLQAAHREHRIALPGVEMRYVATTRKSVYPLAFALRRTVAFDVVHACDHSAGPLALRARIAPLPLVVELHPGRLHTEGFLRAGWRWRWMRLAIRCARRIRVPSQWLAEALVATYGVDPQRVHAIPHGVGEHWFAAAPDAPPRAAAPPRIALVNMRGAEVALGALALLSPRFPELRLALYGVHRRPEALRALAGELGVAARVDFAGFVPNPELPARLAGAVALVHPTDAESFGKVLAEAAALGLPAVASRVGAVPELVRDGETGLLCPPGDAGAFAAALARLLEDPGRREALARAAHARARTLWRWDAVARQIEAVLYAPLVGATRTIPMP